MTMQHRDAITRSTNSKLSLGSSSVAEALLRRIVGRLERGELVIEAPSGHRLILGGRRRGPLAKATIHTWKVVDQNGNNAAYAILQRSNNGDGRYTLQVATGYFDSYFNSHGGEPQ